MFAGCKQMNLTIYGRTARLAHWIIVFAFVGLLFTEVTNQYFYSKSALMESFEFSFSGLGVEATPVEKLFIAKLARREVWIWHFWFGVIFLSTSMLRFCILPKSNRHIVFVSIVSVLFLSGFPLWLRAYIHIASEHQDICRSIHATAVYLLYAFVVFHIFHVLRSEFRSPGYITRIITGAKI